VHVEDRKIREVKKCFFLKKFFAESQENALGEEFFAKSYFLALGEEFFSESYFLGRDFFLLSVKSSSPRARGLALAKENYSW
jgi:hypothetical protein